jgi:hypothetical protein
LSTPHRAQPEGPGTHDPRAEGGDERARSRRFVLALRVLAALSALLSLAALWSVESKQLRHDLQLAAPPTAQPGDRIALRALIFRDVEALEGPALALAHTSVRLLDEEGRELAKVALRGSALSTLDGSMLLPGSATGSFILEARAWFDGGELSCRRPLRVEPGARRVTPRGREAGALQQFSLGRARARGDAPLPAALLARVVGGACVPGTPCRLLVWMGEPAAALRVRVDASASLSSPPAPSDETAGLVELEVRVHGPEAQLTLEVVRGGALIGERPLRLPVGLAEVALLGKQSLLDRASLQLDYVAPPGRSELTFDVFTPDQWSDVVTRPAPGTPFSLPVHATPAGSGGAATLALAEPRQASYGLVRIQARADRLSAEGAGARLFYLRAPGEDDARALSTLARYVAQDPHVVRSASDAWAAALPPFAGAQPQQTAAFLLASLEELRMPVPVAVSGRPAQLRRLDHTRSLFRFGVAGALVLSAGVIGLSIARRGLLAADEAQAILDQARDDARPRLDEPGDPHVDQAGSARELLSARLRVVLLALAVASAFLAAALLIAAKPLWF